MEIHAHACNLPIEYTLVFESGNEIKLTPRESKEFEKWLEDKMKEARTS